MSMTEPDPTAPEEDTGPMIDPAAHANLVLENALLRAGVDLETEQGVLVRSAWEGKEPDGDAIKRQWELVKPSPENADPVETPEPRIEGEEGQAGERRALVGSAVVEPNPEDVDPRAAAVEAGREVLVPTKAGGRAGTREDAVATGLHVLLEAAANGDQRVLVQDAPVR